jgi:hypothetical protein
MASFETYEKVANDAEALAPHEQLRLIERLVRRLREQNPQGGPPPRWQDYAGSAPAPMCGEDAQQWVSRSRAESDDKRSRR